MKTIQLFVRILFLMALLSFIECTKSHFQSNVNLIGESTNNIEEHIAGKWRLHYMQGGICGNCKFDREQFNEYYEFLPGRKIKYTFQGSVLRDNFYDWTIYQANPDDYAHKIMIYSGYSFEAEKIVNDTLILAEPFKNNPDYMTYFLTKEK